MKNSYLINQIKIFLVKHLNANIVLSNKVIILGNIPFFKIPKNGIVTIKEKVVLNSDFKNSNTALTYRCKFVTGINGSIFIDEGTMLNGVSLVAYESIIIGKYCQIASSTLIADTDFHPVDPRIRRLQAEMKPFSFDSVQKEKIIIGDNVWIGWNCTVLKGVQIGNDSIVAAKNIVLKGIYPERVLLAGNHAKIVKKL